MKLIQRSSSLPATFLVCLAAVSCGVVAQECPPSGKPLQIDYTTPKTTCNRPTQDGDKIRVHYKGTLLSNGNKFDSSYDRGVPFEFPLGKHRVIAGWDQGLKDMCVGDKRILTIAPELAYGNRNLGAIPACSTLVFETELMQIVGVPAKDSKPSQPPPPPSLPPSPPIDSHNSTRPDEPHGAPEDDKSETPPHGPEGGPRKGGNGECSLLGPFALIVQAALGMLALLSLVFKRWREQPRRPVKVWAFDASKQVVGTALLHVLNLAMSMFSSGGSQIAQIAAQVTQSAKDKQGHVPNPCSFYLLNLAIDTTIGIPVLVVFLKVLYRLFLYTPLANPPESIRSGHYGQPARTTWWLKQCLIYFLGLFFMKLCVFFLFSALPWLAWVGDWALRWTEGNESLQIAFVMFIFPLAMNALQYYIIDAYIKDHGERGGQQGYQSVQTDEVDSDEGEQRERLMRDEDSEESVEVKNPRTSSRPVGDGQGSSSRSSPPASTRDKNV